MRLSELELRIPGDCLTSFVEVFAGDYAAPVKITGPVRVLDIGANVGAFALYARTEWPHSTIYCYEPHPDLYLYLTRNTSHMQRIYRFNAAVGDTAKDTLYECPDSRTCGSQYEADNKTTRIPIAVISPAVLPEADIVKIDVEGAEADIVAGLEFTPRVLMLEWHTAPARVFIDEWSHSRGMMLVKSKVLAQNLGLACYVKEDAQ